MSAPEETPHPLESLSGTADPPPSSTSDPPLDASTGSSSYQPALDSEEHPFGVPGPPISRHSPFYKGFWTGLGVLLALALGIAVREARSVIVLVLVSIFLAVGLNPVVEWLQRRGVTRRWAVIVVALGVLAVLILFVFSLVPVLRDQIAQIISNGPQWLDSLRQNGTIRNLDAKYGVIDKVTEKLQDPSLATSAFGSIFTVGLAVLSGLLNAFLVLVMTLYFLSALPQIKSAVYSLAPASRRERVTHLGDEILRGVGGYVSGAFVVAMCAGTTSFVFLVLAGLGKYALALALVVTVLDFIPLIGATIAFHLVYQQIENYVLYPRVMRSSVDVPGVVTVVAVLIGGSLMGVVGAMLAIPMAAAVLLLTREIVVRRQDDA